MAGKISSALWRSARTRPVHSSCSTTGRTRTGGSRGDSARSIAPPIHALPRHRAPPGSGQAFDERRAGDAEPGTGRSPAARGSAPDHTSNAQPCPTRVPAVSRRTAPRPRVEPSGRHLGVDGPRPSHPRAPAALAIVDVGSGTHGRRVSRKKDAAICFAVTTIEVPPQHDPRPAPPAVIDHRARPCSILPDQYQPDDAPCPYTEGARPTAAPPSRHQPAHPVQGGLVELASPARSLPRARPARDSRPEGTL